MFNYMGDMIFKSEFFFGTYTGECERILKNVHKVRIIFSESEKVV